MAFCDVDDLGVKAAADSSCDPCRTLPVHMDVTNEREVAAAFDRILRYASLRHPLHYRVN